MHLKEIFVVAVLLVVVAGAQIFDVFGEPDKTEFGLEIDEVYLTDLELAPVTTHYMRQAEKRHRNSKELDLQQLQSNRTLRYLDDEAVASVAKNMSCGFCHARLLWGDSGVIESPNFPHPYGPNMDCLWLLQTADEDARIKLVCDTIQLEACGAQNGFAPSWKDHLIISPLWNFKKSWVYCGFATTLTSVRHTSICSQMAITFRSNNNNKNFRGFHCTYTVV